MEISISVRNLVEFLMRSGDIDNRRSTAPEDAMQEGSRIHRMLQKKAGSDYQAEVVLKYQYHTEKYDICIEGRADGIIGGLTADLIAEEELFCGEKKSIEYHPVVIDEIKGTFKELHKVLEPMPVHLAQAKCYAYFYAEKNDMPWIRVRITYCNIDTEVTKYFLFEYSLEELKEWFGQLMADYQKWADYSYEWDMVKQTSIKQLSFPFEYREGQKNLITYVYQTIYHKKKLFIEAPTGVGKTISTVFPAVKAVGEGLAEKIFYLTAKTITRTVAEETFDLLRKNGLLLKTIILTAKEKMCFQEEVLCNPVACSYAKGHFDRINDAMFDLLHHEVGFTREIVEQYARKYQVCPFEMSLDMSLFSDGIICDYNYVFDPHVYLRRFFGENTKQNYIFLVDEAHNLLDRGREMYSAVLKKEEFLALKKKVYELEPKMGRALERCNQEMLALKKECENYLELDSVEALVATLNRLSSILEKYLEEHQESSIREDILQFYFVLSHFLFIYEKTDENYVIYSEMQPDGSFIVKLFCVNPATNLKECMKRSRSSILFSATLLPIQYYKNLLGGDTEDYEVYAESVFDPARRHLIIAKDVTSKYSRRKQSEYNRIASYIKQITNQKCGNYIIFFPSYAFLREVYGTYSQNYMENEKEECILQEEFMDEIAREDFLLRFTDSWNHEIAEVDFGVEIKMEVEIELQEKSLLGFCVMGGIFSEGIDLKNDRLIGAIIVGTGIPQVCNEREIMSRFFSTEVDQGFYYAYQYPGMNKVAQAAGRVIRTSQDVGIVALLDERFLQKSYQKMFPKEWSQYYQVSLEEIADNVKKFWKQWE